MALVQVGDYLKLIPPVKGASSRYLWSFHAANADALFINIQETHRATGNEPTEDDIIVRYEGDEVIRLTILHASQCYLSQVRERRHEPPSSSPPPPSPAPAGS